MDNSQPTIKLAAVSGILRHYPLELALDVFARSGYEGVELWGGQFHGHVWDFVEESNGRVNLDRDRIRAVRAMCDAAGLEIAGYTPEMLLYPTNYLVDQVPPFDGQALRARSRLGLELCTEVAAELGCNRMTFISPMWQWVQEGGTFRKTHLREMLESIVEELGRCVEHAAALETDILFEPLVYHDTNGIATLEEAQELFGQIDAPNLKMLIDFGHVAVTANREDIDPVAYLRKHFETFGDRIAHVHIDDNDLVTDSHLAPGEGLIDLQAMTDVGLELGYAGWLVAELAILGPYALPENAERLLADSRKEMSTYLSR